MSTPTKPKHTPGAIRAAEILSGSKYGTRAKFATIYGEKTVEGMADIIDRETHAPELLEALKRISIAAGNRANEMGDPCRMLECKSELAAANLHALGIIAKAEGLLQ